MASHALDTDIIVGTCPVCNKRYFGWLIGHLKCAHGIEIKTNLGTVQSVNGDMLVECLCGKRFLCGEFYRHIAGPDAPCRINYLLLSQG